MSSNSQPADRSNPQPVTSFKESWQRGKRIVFAYVSINMVLFPVAIAFGHAPGLSMTQTIGTINLVAAGAALALSRWRPNTKPTGWLTAVVTLLGYGIAEMWLGITAQSPGWIAVRNALGLYLVLIVLVVVYSREQ
ncbi:hypothetical protein [Halorhabdus sp. CUG00001]|uniref:hypothetical protein n=1 Tax=Halorhabdus sp. CUG00001 TaxID=2600297 RepID=UPI00131AB042|nr:hypothetical protein [Halorhabdus sp. CUG00001]